MSSPASRSGPKKLRIKPKVFTKQPFVGSASTPGALWQQVRANPSVKRTPNGLGPLQALWLLSFRGPKPSVPAYLKR